MEGSAMSYVQVWTLQRGVIDPPEPVDAFTGAYMTNQDVQRVSIERDPPLTQRQRWHELDMPARYIRKSPRMERMMALAGKAGAAANEDCEWSALR